MISRYEASLNNLPLSGISASILILDISHKEPALRTESYTVAKRSGSRLYLRSYEKAETTITFMIREYSTEKRQMVVDAVNNWAKDGGFLRTSDRAGKHLNCVCDKFAAVGSAKKWLDPIQMTFTAYECPFWEADDRTEIYFHQMTDSDYPTGNQHVFVPGNVTGEAFVEAEIYINQIHDTDPDRKRVDFTLVCNGRGLRFAGLTGCQVGQRLFVTYDEHRIQHITSDAASPVDWTWMQKSNGVDLIADCGKVNEFGFYTESTYSAVLSVWFRVRGLYA